MNALPPGADLSKIPMGVNPSGAPPNFDHGSSLIQAVQGVGISMAIIATFFLLARLHLYTKLNHGLVLDDVFLIIAHIMALSYTIQVSTLARLCRHTWDTPISAVNEDYIKKLFATSIVYGPMFFFAKSAILILYHRAFKPKAWMRRSCWVMAFILFGAYWQTVPQTFVYCMPHHGNSWNFSVLQRCSHLKIPGLVHGAMNVVADIIMVLMPIPIIAKLQIPLGKKIAISAIFATGLLALVCSVLAVYYRVEISYGKDPVWSNAQAWIVIQAEIYAAICVACAPSFAKASKFDFRSNRLYASIQSFLHSSNNKQASYPSVRGTKEMKSSSESISALQGQSSDAKRTDNWSSTVYASNEGFEMGNIGSKHGVLRQVTVDVKSQGHNGKVV